MGEPDTTPPTTTQSPSSVFQFALKASRITQCQSQANSLSVSICFASNEPRLKPHTMASAPDIAALKDAVYNGCFAVWEENGLDPKMTFRQQDIIDLDVIPGDDLQVLLQVVQKLIDDKLFRTMMTDGVAWMLRTAEDAKRYRGLTAEQEIVYALIDEAASDGAWSKTIKMKTNLHDSIFHSKHNVSPVRQAKKVHKKMTPEEIKALRDQGLGGARVKDEPDTEVAAKKRKYDNMLPMPAGYQGYPTLNELTLFVENANIFSQTLAANDIQQLLDIMCYDDRIDRVINGSEGVSYRALRKSLRDEEERNSLLSEVPCGRCPVFDLCEEGGPVSPSNCEYFNDWLSI